MQDSVWSGPAVFQQRARMPDCLQVANACITQIDQAVEVLPRWPLGTIDARGRNPKSEQYLKILQWLIYCAFLSNNLGLDWSAVKRLPGCCLFNIAAGRIAWLTTRRILISLCCFSFSIFNGALACVSTSRKLFLNARWYFSRKETKNYTGSKTLPASIKEKETHWPEVPWVSPAKWCFSHVFWG